MTPEEDARATWDLLTAVERQVLAAIDRRRVMTPQSVGDDTGMAWQRAARIVGQLSRFRLVYIRSLPKQTSYELTVRGQACLAAGKETGDDH